MHFKLVKDLTRIKPGKLSRIPLGVVVREKPLTKDECPSGRRQGFESVVHTAADVAPVEGGWAGGSLVAQVRHQEGLDWHFRR